MLHPKGFGLLYFSFSFVSSYLLISSSIPWLTSMFTFSRNHKLFSTATTPTEHPISNAGFQYFTSLSKIVILLITILMSVRIKFEMYKIKYIGWQRKPMMLKCNFQSIKKSAIW